MSQFARVTNVEVLADFKAALAGFAETAGLGLSEAQSDVQRTIWWIQQDRLSHWQRELKKRTDKLYHRHSVFPGGLYTRTFEEQLEKRPEEIIRKAVPDVGYLHRSIEKIGERCTYPGYMPYTDRVDYVAAMFANSAGCR